MSSDRTRGNGHKLRHRKLQLNIRKKFFTLRVAEPWPRLPRGAMESPSLEIFQPRLDEVVVQPALGDPILAEGLDLVIPRGPFQPLPCWDSVILQLLSCKRAQTSLDGK